MKRFMLLRHALPETHGFNGQDKDRPLRTEGIAQAQKMGDIIRTQNFMPDYIACSSVQRTRETLQHLKLDDIKTEYFDHLYLPKRQTIEEHIKYELPENSNCALFIIHFPGVLDFTYRYADHIHNFPEASLAIFDCDIETWDQFEKPELKKFITV